MDHGEDLGAALAAARQAGVPWKILQRRYDKSRQHLHNVLQAHIMQRRGELARAVRELDAMNRKIDFLLDLIEGELERQARLFEKERRDRRD